MYDVIAGTFLVVGLGEEDFVSLSPELAQKYDCLLYTSVIVALCTVHSVIDSDEADTFLWENHFRVHSHLQVVSP